MPAGQLVLKFKFRVAGTSPSPKPLGAMCRASIEHLCLIIFFSFSFFCPRSLKK